MRYVRHPHGWLAVLAVVGLSAITSAQQPLPPAPASPSGPITLTSEQPAPERLPPPKAEGGPANRQGKKDVELPPPPPSLLGPDMLPIDLGSALKLAGVDNPEILLARQRVVEAAALRQLAAAQLLPNLNVGFNSDNHVGVLQQSNGNILKVNRNAIWTGLGANAVAAGTVNIPGIQMIGNLAEGIFGALVSRQVVRQREFASLAVRNDVLLRVALAYMDLLEAEGRRAILVQIRDDNREVARLTTAYYVSGQGRKADADRATTELLERDSEVLEAERAVITASAQLARLLNLDPSVRLHAIDGWVVPAPIVPEPVPLCELLAIAMSRRPELAEQQAAIQAAFLTLRGAKVLPFSPNYIMGYSAGTFGGGSNLVQQGFIGGDGKFTQQPRFDSFAPREDVDVILYWTARNMGLGNLALIRTADARLGISRFRLVEILNRVRLEVARAFARTHARYAQIGTSEQAVRTSANGFKEDMIRIRGREGLPIEVLDSLRLLERSRTAYLHAITDFNRAEFELYVALGQPPANCLARPIPPDLVPPPAPPAPGACPPGPNGAAPCLPAPVVQPAAALPAPPASPRAAASRRREEGPTPGL